MADSPGKSVRASGGDAGRGRGGQGGGTRGGGSHSGGTRSGGSHSGGTRSGGSYGGGNSRGNSYGSRDNNRSGSNRSGGSQGGSSRGNNAHGGNSHSSGHSGGYNHGSRSGGGKGSSYGGSRSGSSRNRSYNANAPHGSARNPRAPRPTKYDPAPAFDIPVTNLETGRTVQVRVRDKGADQFAARLKKVARERRKWAREQDISCYRIYDADLPDFAVAIDRYDGVWESEGESCLCIAEYQAPPTIDASRARARLLDAIDIAQATLDIPHERVFLKTRRHDKGGGQYVDQQKQGHVLYTQEAGNVFEVDLGAYLDTGIFLDHRDTRAMVGSMAEGKKFLNLFAYTGTCTVHAAMGGAKSTLTVDLSQTYLAWAHRNMLLNGCDGPEHGYVRADVLQWLESAVHEWRRFDLVFVDPPTFSNSKAMGHTTWSVQRDHVHLLSRVVELLEPEGVAVFSCNLRNFKPDFEGLAAAGVQLEDITERTIPPDFARNPKIHSCYLARRA